ncbi:hypothetical protein ACJIZ3_021341 [Penstemon smallii]|uniref:J domain-containing protein n=1 Tax=Penstemon smallii TaxID=265156 RepID=A0ABD3SLG9_9LAMI
MECNKDEAIRAKELAEKKMSANDFEGARKIALKAQNLYPELDNITQMLGICDVHCSAQKRILGSEKDWYEILQVGRSADEFAIKKQFRRLALILHPDKNRFPGADSAFQLISEANAVLSDTTKKSIYDSKVRISVRIGPRNPPTQPMNKRAQNNGFSSINQSQTQSSSSVRTEVFWTSCEHCSTRYQYLIEFVNRALRCIKCGKAFNAYEASARGAFVSSNWGHPGAAQSATMGSNQVHPSSSQGATVGSNQGHPGAHVPSKPDLSKPATFQNDKGSSASHAGSEGIASRKTSIPGPGIQRGSGSESNRAASSFKESDDLKANVTDNQNVNSMHGGKKSENSNNVAMDSESEDLKHKSRKRGRKLVVESSESFDSSTNSDLEDVITKASFGDPAADVDSGPSHSQNQRRSLRKREHVSYNENDNHLASPLKKQKASENTKDDGEEQKDAFNGETSFMANNAADTVEIESDSDIDSNSKDDSNEGKKCDCPELDFDNFKRDPNHFEAGQFWACYDTADGMPRFYAKVKKASADPFEVSFTWLEAVPIDEALEDWVDEELPVGCGTFKLQKPDSTEAIETFSHQVHCVKGYSLVRGKKRGSLVIHPREGEVWAVFKDWNLGWSLDSENHRKYKYEVVEVLSDFVPGFGIKVCYLDKVKGFKSLFQRSNENETASFVVGPNELYKFSHCVPFYKTTGTEKEGVPVGLFELDTAALPMNPADLYYPNKTKMESENTEPGVHSSLPKSDINKGKSVITESTSTPKKKAEEMLKPRRSPRGLSSTN